MPRFVAPDQSGGAFDPPNGLPLLPEKDVRPELGLLVMRADDFQKAMEMSEKDLALAMALNCLAAGSLPQFPGLITPNIDLPAAEAG